MFDRSIYSNLKKVLFKNKLIILYGPRQVGKTTLVNKLTAEYEKVEYLTGDDSEVRRSLSQNNLNELINLFKNTKILIIDEAQKIVNIGNALKLLVDNLPNLQVIATGSSSFELANKIREPLTGRYYQFFLYPLSFTEIINKQASKFHYQNVFNRQLIYGSYPEVYLLDNTEASQKLTLITGDYLYRDIFSLQQVKNPALLENLSRALAFQIGNEVSLNELANLLDTPKETIARYLDLLQKAFVIFRLPSFSRNLRKEIAKNSKYYFYDLGIRNSLIQNFNPLELRNDQGALWENYCILERKKYLEYMQMGANFYFWRNYEGQEIDFVEERGGKLHCYEFKWNSKKKAKLPNSFQKAYPNNSFAVVNPDNWLEFVYPNQ
jgi:uncharacterized protein